jgi:hypothetical protein
MLELLMVMPGTYGSEQANSFDSNVQNYLGGMPGVSDRLFNKMIGDNEEDIIERAMPRARALINIHASGRKNNLNEYNSRAGKNVEKLLKSLAQKILYKQKLGSLSLR